MNKANVANIIWVRKLSFTCKIKNNLSMVLENIAKFIAQEGEKAMEMGQILTFDI